MSTLINQARTRLPRFADAAVARARLAVVPERSEETSRAPFVILVVLLLAGGVAGLLAFNTSMQQSSFKVTALESKASALTAHKQSLELALEARRDPQQLAVRAKALGMVPPPDPAFVRLSDGAVLGTPTAATPGDAMRINPFPAIKPDVLSPTPRIVRVPAATEAEIQAKTDKPVASTTGGSATTAKKNQTRKQHQGRGGQR